MKRRYASIIDADRYATTPFGAPRRVPGRHGYTAYFPTPIPRSLEISSANQLLVADAEAALGRLAGAGRLLPTPHLLVQPYLRREAVASARIEGTQASLADVFDVEADDRPPGPDVEEVVNYVLAMEHGLSRLADLPFSLRLLREIHADVLAGVRGRERLPGEIRRTQNWIGAPGATLANARFVPPPPEALGDLLSDLESFVHDGPVLPPLIEAALLHYQFETLHPFLDGNGRLGRLLIVFFLVLRGRLPEPLLYISPYFEEHRDEYYMALQGVREHGDIDRWLSFFLLGVSRQATDAVSSAEQLLDLRELYRQQVQAVTRGAANQLAELIFLQPIVTSRLVESRLQLTRASAITAMRQLADLGVLTPVADGPRGQMRYRAEAILATLSD